LEQEQNANESPQPPGSGASEGKGTSETATSQTTIMPPGMNEEPSKPLPQTQTANFQQQTAEMEVHKHPHHVMHKKKWSEYVLEFFMIFLAVTMGFFAENIREKISEHKHEKQYVKLLLEDLMADTAVYRRTKQLIGRSQKDFDSLFRLLTDTPPQSDKNILQKFLPLGYTYKMRPTTTTYNQMKSSGTLRYIENEKLLHDIQTYYEINIPSSQEFADMMNDFFNQHVVPFYINNVRSQDWNFRNDSLTTNNPIIVDRTPKLDQQMANIMANYGHLLEAYVRTRLTRSEEQAKKVIADIEDGYHFSSARGLFTER
jgi:hypothetical protein